MASCILSCLKFFQLLKMTCPFRGKAPAEVGALEEEFMEQIAQK
jgi:hypothetical protein